MNVVRRLPLYFLTISLLLPAALFAQEGSLEALLPADTLAYASWRGEPGMAAHRATNSLVQLWSDPDLAPARALMAGGMFLQDAKDLPPLTHEEITLLFGNPALVAYIKLPAGVKPHEKLEATKPAAGSRDFEGAMLLIYDRAGREPLIDRLMQWSPEGKPASEVKKTPFHGMEIQELKSGSDTSYRTLAGHYFVQSDYREVLEHWATRLASAAPGRGTLVETAEFHSARQRIGPGAAVTAFFNLRVLFEHARAQMKDEQQRQTWDAMHFDRLHSVVGSVTLGDPATRIEFSMLGDLTSGGFFDLIGTSGPDFPTLKMTPDNVFSYSATRLDLSAFYRIVRSIFESLMPAGQGIAFDQFDVILTKQFGMSMNEMLKLLSGDFTFIKQEPAGDLSEGIFILGVEKPADVQHVLELLLSSMITNEETIGDVTLLSIVSPVVTPAGTAVGTPKAKGRFYCVALGPKMLVVAHRKSDARAFLARARETEGTKSLGADPKFQAERARLPKNLSALSYADLSRVDWKDVVDKVAALQKAPIDPQKLETIKNMFPTAAFARHFHSFVTGMWKDRTGIFYDGYIE
jgi:hypothetical protein